MPTLSVPGGAALAYDDHGDGSPPLLFVHGGAGDRTIWAPQVQDLSGDFRCVAVDLRGYGESQPVPPFGPAQQADDLAALLDALGLERSVVVGHSLGGLAALLLNRQRPDLVGGVAVIDTPLTREGVDPTRLAGMLRDAASTELLVTRFFGETSGFARSVAAPVIQRSRLDVVAAHLEAAVVDPPTLREVLEAAGAKPFLAIWPAGPHGEGPRSADPQWLAEVVPGIRQEHVPGRHFIHLDQPTKTNAILREFAAVTNRGSGESPSRPA